MKLTKAAQFVVLASLAMSISMVDAKKKKTGGSKKKTGGSKKSARGDTTIIVKTVPVPVPVPVPIIIDRVPGDGITDRTPGCVVCDDLRTPWMIQNSKTCQDWAMTDARCASKSKYWTDNKFCRFTCADLAMPYDNDVCCDIQEDDEIPVVIPPPSPSPTASPTCTECTNMETLGMRNNGLDCTDLNYAFGRCRDKTSYWVDNKWCQRTCYKLNQGYDGDECCQHPTASPTAAPTKGPTPAPSKSPTPAPTKSPTPVPSAKPTKSPTADPTSSPTETIVADSCIVCSNKPSPQMTSDGHTCETWSMAEDNCYDKPADWRHYKYCSKYCSDRDLPYGGTRCCTEDDINRVDDDDDDENDDDEYPQLMFGEDSDEMLADCSGDCDVNDDCESGLICVQRSGYDEMPGCAGDPRWNTDYCLDPSRNFKELAFLGQRGPFGRCAGDCDNDFDCVGDLICFQRDGEVNNVPGCPGRAVDNVDYCISPPTPAPTPAPTQSPTSSLNRVDDCIQCQDKQTPYMKNKGISCKNWAMTQYRCTEQSSYYSFWQQERFCELSCAEGGSPYPGPSCCGVETDENERGTGDTGGSKKKRNNGRRKRNLGKNDNSYDV